MPTPSSPAGPTASAVPLWAAIFATRSDSAARAANRDAAARHSQLLIPRVQCVLSRTAPVLHAEILNLGGATPSTLIFVAMEGQLWTFAGALPEHSPRGLIFPLTPMPMAKTNGQERFVVSAAKDVSGRWWDNFTGAVSR
mgnify:CR=1 FL=1